ncbi:protein of unknown function [Pilibacter termitis]|uniref:IrrE N-terminal-like domain-containing protein n=1 Tax=Pilibacter termitis TaxID=263852 RepID=A0A1T4RC63_9ENTE|nr:ImmA/IrrE family metallo-endopeptidase [Pilibacter termitis]SKA13477.1 protein of unknown function [Pilibacter termitis]
MIDKEVNFKKAQLTAFETIKKSKQTKLPICVKSIIENEENIHLIRYSSVAKKEDISIKEVVKTFGSKDGLTIYQGGKYVIYYNDRIIHEQRIRFTLAHELGHILLGHLSEENCIHRNYIHYMDNNIFEKEANYFAKNLLAPRPLIHLYDKRRNIDRKFIEKAFGISREMSRFVHEQFEKDKENGIYPHIHEINQQFEPYISEMVRNDYDVENN